MTPLKHRIYGIIEDDTCDSAAHRLFEGCFIAIVLANALAIILESVLVREVAFFKTFEIFSIFVFIVDYGLRLWTADLRYAGSRKPWLRFMLSPMGMIDLLSVVPFFITLLVPIGLDGRILQLFRLSRLVRILKLTRYLDSLKIITRVFRNRWNELMMTAFITFLILLVASTLMYEIEHSVQPDKFPDVISSFWWAVATLTTIGYGDVYPVTGIGKFLSCVISLLGIGLVALPAGILSSSFIDEFRNHHEKTPEEISCPHCGKNIHPHS